MSTDLDRYAASHYCTQCGMNKTLTVRWWQGAYQVWCPNCRATQDFEPRREKSYKRQWLDDPESVNVAIANKMSDKYGDDIRAVAAYLPPELGRILIKKYLPTTEQEK